MEEHNDTEEAVSSTPQADVQQIAQIVAAMVDQKVSARIQQIEKKQAATDQTMEQLPGLVQQFQAMLPAMIQQAVQQNLAAVMQQIPKATSPAQVNQREEALQPLPQPSQDGGAGRIPLGMSVTPETPSSSQQMVSPNLPETQSKASDLVKQMAGAGMAGMGGLDGIGALLGGGAGGGMQQILMQMLLQKLLVKDEEKKQPNPMEMLMGMANMVNQFADAMGMIVGSVDRIRGGFLEQKMQEAQINQIEAKSEAEVIRALNAGKKAGGTKS